MDYVELANKASEYGLFKEASGAQGQVIYMACIIVAVLLALVFIILAHERDARLASWAVLWIIVFIGGVCLFAYIYPKLTDRNKSRLEELRKLAYDNNISSLENLVDNVNYLSNKYDNKIGTFRIMYKDNVPSRKDYINNILAEFYGSKPASGNFDYSAEYKELANALR